MQKKRSYYDNYDCVVCVCGSESEAFVSIGKVRIHVTIDSERGRDLGPFGSTIIHMGDKEAFSE